MNDRRRLCGVLLVAFTLFSLHAEALDISSGWRIHKGDDTAWAAPDFDDSAWQAVVVGKPWEQAGLPGYDGYAWYRVEVTVPRALSQGEFAAHYKTFTLTLGAIDDTDTTYFNGVEVGTGQSYDAVRRYTVPFDLVRWDAPNVIAVRVFDSGLDGGLYRGPYTLDAPEWRQYVDFDIPLAGGDGIFSGGAPMDLSLDIANTAYMVIDGTMSWEVHGNTWRASERGAALATHQAKLSLNPDETERAEFKFTPPEPGFYHVTCTFTDDGDTEPLVESLLLGYAPEEEVREPNPPADMRTFWDATLAELADIDPEFKRTPSPEYSTAEFDCFLLEFRSLGNARIRGWYEVPKQPGPHPAVLRVPGYTGTMTPSGNARNMVVLSLNIRGHGNSQDDVPGGPPDFILRGIEHPKDFFYRGAYMDCVRAVNFLASRPEVDATRIGVQGGSQGGMLSLATAALSPRIALSMPDIPFVIDSGRAFDSTEWPGSIVRGWVAEDPANRTLEAAYETMRYFDPKNLAPWIRCPVFMGIGLQDPVCPAPTNFAAYNNVTTEKEYHAYPFAGHGVPGEHYAAQFEWLSKHFGP